MLIFGLEDLKKEIRVVFFCFAISWEAKYAAKGYGDMNNYEPYIESIRIQTFYSHF